MRQRTYVLFVLFLFFIQVEVGVGQTIADTLEQKILSAQAGGRVVDNLNNSFALHPAGEFLIAPQNKDLKFGILIYNIEILPDRAVFSAGIAFRDPKSNQLVAFRSDNIAFSNSGGLSGPVKLYLVSDVMMNLGKAADIILKAGLNETYAVFDCNGLREFAIKGDVLFNTDFLLPVDENGEIILNDNLTASFECMAKSWSEILVQISMQPFQVKGLTNFIFTINNAIMDLSESMNSSDMNFPLVYNVSDLFGSQKKLWEGFYLQKGSVILPKHFHSDAQQRIEIGVTDLLIDEFGFSGNIFGKNILDFEKGRISNWHFSIEQIDLSIAMNEIVEGNLFGNLGLPVLPDTCKLAYNAYIGVNDNYGMQVVVKNDLKIPALKVTKLLLHPNSYVEVGIRNGIVKLKAELNGDLMIERKNDSLNKGPDFKFPSIAFQGFRVANYEPEIDIQYLGIKNTSEAPHFSKYPLTINEIYYQSNGNTSGIGLRFGLNLMEKISVRSGIVIVGDKQADKFSFKKVEINDIDLNVAFSCFSFNGRLSFINGDLVYGNGMQGAIKFKLSKPKIEADANVIFGIVNHHRYWYFDTDLIWDKPGIPFFPGAEMNGFTGGAWQGMRETKQGEIIRNTSLGLLSNGKRLIPDVTYGLGLKAGVYIKSTGGTANSSPFIAKTVMELQFNANSGLNRIVFYGRIDVMTEDNKINSRDMQTYIAGSPALNTWENYKSNYRPMGKVGGPFLMDFDFVNKAYQANFGVYLHDIASGKISGSGTKGFAGESSLYFSSSKWYLWIGTPKQPVNINLNLGAIGNASIAAYFMSGTDVKPAEPLPPEIRRILGERHSDEMRKLSDIAIGNSFAFGSRLYLQIGGSGGENNVSIYASLKAIVGFDINVASYGKSVICEGHQGSPGINGWFANGQLFAFLQGKVGASYKAGGVTGKVDLFTLTTAASLYCPGPNPFYSNGSASVQVNIAGVINKSIRLNFEIGEQCQLNKIRYTDTAIILETNPVNGDRLISTLNNIKTKFSVPIEKSFTDIEGRAVVFRLSQYNVTADGQSIKGKINWNKELNALTFNQDNFLPENKRINVRVVVEAIACNHYYELQYLNGKKCIPSFSEQMKYNACVEKMKSENLEQLDFGPSRKIIRSDKFETIVLNGQKVQEIKDFYFNTSVNPVKIPDNNIAFAYPVPDQLNYYKGLSNTGTIQLVKGQDYLTNVPNTKTMAVFVSAKGLVIGESRVVVNDKRLQFTIPNSVILNGEIYRLLIKRTNLNSVPELGKNINQSLQTTNGHFTTESAILSGGTGISSGISGSKVAGIETQELVLFAYSFGVSRYNHIEDKFKDEENIRKLNISDGVIELKLVNKKAEYLDIFELKKSNNNPLISMELKLDQSTWFQNEGKKVYSIFNSKNPKILSELSLNRDTVDFGLYPFKAVKAFESDLEKMFLKNVGMIPEKSKPAFTTKELLIANNMYEVILSDFNNIKTSLINVLDGGDMLNLKEIQNYINLFPVNDFVKTESRLGSFQKSVNAGLQNNLSVNSLNISSLNMQATKSSITIPPMDDQKNSEWLLKLSGLKLAPLYENSEYPVQIFYRLPGKNNPIASIKIRTK